MVEIGDRIKVGTVAPNTGYYRHSLCSTTEAFVHGSILERCPNDDCLDCNADWIFQSIPIPVRGNK
jgi:hypothetical protein